ncbi:response regulator [Paludibacterium yongneupense]|uniref:response regulator n=1 Tax=Paludibacterium yongneupense TaxID=400061 RepID=UPI0004290404|nr:response regulator transcription factor [Paludibacterium yongneupense]
MDTPPNGGETGMKVLLMEDDLAQGDALSMALRQIDVRTVWVRRLKEARALLQAEPLDALLLDLGMQDGEGMVLWRELRERRSRLPVIVLAARDRVEGRLPSTDIGASDCLLKPFTMAELLARLRAATRRKGARASDCWDIGELCIDTGAHQVTLAGGDVPLSPSEYALLLELAREGGRVVARDLLLARLQCGSDNALEVHVHNLRRKLGCGWVRTQRGVGYLLPIS